MASGRISSFRDDVITQIMDDLKQIKKDTRDKNYGIDVTNYHDNVEGWTDEYEGYETTYTTTTPEGMNIVRLDGTLIKIGENTFFAPLFGGPLDDFYFDPKGDLKGPT